MVVAGWGGVDPRTVEDTGNNVMPLWHPDGLFYLRGSSTKEMELDVMSIPVTGAEPRVVCQLSLRVPLDFGSYEPSTRRFAYTLERVEADVYLAQPAAGLPRDPEEKP